MGNGDGPTEPIAPELIVDEKEKNLHQVRFQANMRILAFRSCAFWLCIFFKMKQAVMFYGY